MNLELENKVIIVSGGSKGIGSGIVSILAQEGALPIIVGRTQKDVLKAVKQHEQDGLQVGYAFC